MSIDTVSDAIIANLDTENKRLSADLAAARAERDGLAKALRELLDRITPPRPSGYVSLHFPAEQLADARAALAALPPNEDDA